MKARLFGKSLKGSSTLEIVIAFAILTLSLTSVIVMVFGNQSVSIDTQTNNEALYKAQSLIEEARANSRQDFNSVNSVPAVTDGIYQKTLDVVVDPQDSSIKKVTSTVSWVEAGRSLLIKLVTLLTNPVVGGDTCSVTLSGDWAHPQLMGTADVGQNNGGTDVDVLSKKAYVTANSSSAGKPDFYVVDVSDATLSNLPILGNVDTGPGLAGVRVAGKYAYVANISTVSQLQVIDISNSASPTLVKTLKVTPAGDTAVGNSIFYANKKVYLGLDRPSGGSEFFVIDVTDPLNPSVKASVETNTAINMIRVKDGIAYLATRYGTNGVSAQQLRVFDVSNADTGTIVELNPFGPNPSTMSGESLDISKDGKTLFLGEGGANPGNKPELFSLDVTTPNSMSQNFSKYIPTANSITINAVKVRSNLVFLWTSDPNLGFQIWDMNNLSSQTPYASLNTQQTPTGGLDCEGNIIYTAQRSQQALQIIGPGPVAVSSFDLAIHNASHTTITTGNAGDSVHAAATVAGGSGTPTGTVSFTFYPNSTCGSGAGSAGTVTLVNGVADPSTIEGPLSAGPYSFKAHYNGDFSYSSADSSCMPLTVNKVSPSLTTTPSAGGSMGTAITDTATLFGSYNPTGNMTFKLYAPSDPTCTGVPVFISTKPTAGSSITSSSFTSSAVGTYHWIATYAGDTNNNAVAGQCSDEPVAITAAVPFDYTLANSGNITAPQQSQGSNTLTLTLTAGVGQVVTLSISPLTPLPTHTSATFTPASSCTPNFSCPITLTISAQNSANSGTYPITVNASPNGAGGPRSTSFSLIIP